MGPEETVTEIALPALGQRYARLRIVNPSVEALVLRSLQKYGQVSPVMANRAQTEGTYELLDGFKRLRAAEKLGLKHLSTRVLALTPRAAKAAILQLNWVGQSVNHLEEALVLHSLVREDGLSQQEVAVLVPIVIAIFWIGLQPKPFFDTMTASVDQVVRDVEVYLPEQTDSVAMEAVI